MAAFDSIVEFIRNQHHGHPIPLAILVGAALGESIHDAHQLLFHPLDVMRKKVAELKPPSTGSWFLAFFKPFRVFIGKSGRVAHDQSQSWHEDRGECSHCVDAWRRERLAALRLVPDHIFRGWSDVLQGQILLMPGWRI